MAVEYAGLAQMRQPALKIFRAALKAVDPLAAIVRHVKVNDGTLIIGGQQMMLATYDRILVVGAGKAVAPMANALEDLLGDHISTGVILVKDGHGLPLKKTQIREAGHPVPDNRGVQGTEEILALVNGAGKHDLILCLLSGGGSALLIAPAASITLEHKQETTKLLLACGATIHELNAVRKHLSRAKGGGLAKLAYPATMISLILSDVVGDDLDVIASGPTVPDASTFLDAKNILSAYGIWNRVAEPVRSHIQKGLNGEIEETPKTGDIAFRHCSQVLVGTNLHALTAAAKEAQRQGYHPLILSAKMEGEAREVAKAFVAIAREIRSSGNPVEPPCCILAGGETTVTLRGDGRGGRNQEFALAAALALEGIGGVVVLSAGTDGTDGPTEAAGAIADGFTAVRAREKGLDPRDFLRRNDSNTFFQSLGDLVITGPTRTNVMDVYMLLVHVETQAI